MTTQPHIAPGVSREYLLNRLDYWNQRLERFGAEPLTSRDEAGELDEHRLRRVLETTIGKAVDLFEVG